ncbi:MAG TPA: autotransporter-associated beta strand repeat-containing protein, partial [Chthoniobacteraceae bacterium]
MLSTRLMPPPVRTQLFRRSLLVVAASALALGGKAEAATFNWFNNTGLWNVAGNWQENAVPPLADPTTQLIFGGAGATGYTSTNDLGAVQLNILTLNSAATAPNTIAATAGSSLNFVSNAAVTPTIIQGGTGAFVISAPLSLTNNLTVKAGTAPINAGMLTFSGPITPVGTAVFRVENTTSATTTAQSILQVALTGTNGFSGATPIVVNTGTGGTTPTGIGARTVLSLNSPFAVGNSAVNSELAPITLQVNNNTAGPNSGTAGQVSINGTPTDWSSVLQIGATIGASPNAAGNTVNGVTYGPGAGQTPIDFSYQITTGTAAPTAGQIRLARDTNIVNATAGVGFAALGSGTGTANNRVVGLFATGSSTALATLVNRTNYGHGNMDHLTFGSPSANGTLVLLNNVDPSGFTTGNPRGFETIRGVGNVPEANLAGQLVMSSAPLMIFDGNGGMIFSNPGGTGNVGSGTAGSTANPNLPAYSYLLRGGAVYVGANDLGTAAGGALGGNAATFSIGAQNTNANVAFMTYGTGGGVGASPSITTARPVTVNNFSHGSVTLGGFTSDYTAFNGAITLNNAITPTTFIAGNGIGSNGITPTSGGRADFNGLISGASSVVVGPAVVEGEDLAAAPTGAAGIALTQSGMVVFNNAGNSYAGGTTISSGILSTGTAGTLANGGAPSSIGQSDNTAAKLVINGGTLQYASNGAAATTDRLFTVGQNGAALDASGANPVTFAGNGVGAANAIVFTGSGARTLTLKGTNTGANTLAPIIADGTGGATSLVKSGSGAWVVTGASTYTGATSVEGGNLTFGPGATFGSTSVTVAGGGGFAVKPGTGNFQVGTTGSFLSLNAGSAFSMSDGGVGTFTVNTPAAGAGTLLTLGGTTSSPVSLSFDVGTTGADQLIANAGTVSFAASAQNNILLSSLGGPAPGTLTGIPLLSVPNGTLNLSNFSLQTTAVTFGSGSYVANLSLNGGNNQLLLNLVAASLNHYWKGGTSGSWNNAANFVTDPVGATLQVSVPAAQNNVFLTSNSAANLSQTLNATFAINSLSFTGTGTSAGTGSVTLAAGTGGPLTLNAVNPFSDSVGNSYAAGTGLAVQAGSAAHTISTNVVLGANQTWQIDNSAANALTVSGVISGSGRSLTKTGSGRLVLTNANTYDGSTTVNGGILQVGNGVTGSLATGSSVILGPTGTLTLNLPDASIFSNPISGAGNLSVSGPGSTTLSGPNTFAGTTQITSGSLILGNSLALQNSVLNYNNQGGTINFGTLTEVTLGGLNGAQSLALTNTTPAAVALTVGGGDGTYSGVLSGEGSFTKVGATSTQILAGANTYTGATTVSAGTLKAGIASVTDVSGAFGNNSAVTVAGSGTLDITGFDTQIGSLAGGGKLMLGAANLTVGNVDSTSYAGIISGTGQLRKIGIGTLALSGLSTYTGSTVINGGIISIGAIENLGAVPTQFTPDSIIMDGGGLASPGGVGIAFRGITLLAGGGSLGSSGARVTLANSSVVSGIGALTVTGNQLVIQSQNTYSGGTNIPGGVQVLVESNSVEPDDSPASGPLGTGVVNFLGGGIRAAITNAFTVRNLINFSANTTFLSSAAGVDRDLTFTGKTTLVGGTRTFTVNTSPIASETGIFFNGVIGDEGNAFGIIKAGPGTLTLRGANTFTGTTTVTAGTLAVGILGNGTVPSSLGQTSGAAENLLLGNGTTLRYVGEAASTDRTFTATLSGAGQGVTL